MPWASPRPCPVPGCGVLTTKGRCPTHKAELDARIKDKQRAHDQERDSPSKRGYGRHWQKVRLAVLNDEPLCRFCLEQKRTTAATEVDHIDGNPSNNARENLRPLCHSCHSRRTARDQAWGRKAGG